MKKMKTTAGVILAVTGILTALPGSASASHGGVHPTFRTGTEYFHCTGTTKLQPVNNPLGLVPYTYTAWNPTPPSGSLATGAGCGTYDDGRHYIHEMYQPVFEGTFTGNVRDLTVRIDEALSGQVPGHTRQLNVYAEIDGYPLMPDTQHAPPGYSGRLVSVTPTATNSGATQRYEFSITNIGKVTEVFDSEGRLVDVQGSRMADEDGTGAKVHTIQILFGFYNENPVTWNGDAVGLWLWDTTETPSGLVINPPTLADAKVVADLP